MLIAAIVLILIGAVIVAIGKARDRYIVYAGYLVLAIGAILAIIWLVGLLDDNTTTAMLSLA